MRVSNYKHHGFECNYEKEGSVNTLVDELKNHITEKFVINFPKGIPTNPILRKKP